MPTSVHIPRELLVVLDRRARALKISRNQVIVRAIEAALGNASGWSQGFFDQLSSVSSDERDAADEMLSSIVKSRRSKKGPPF
jgi:metal-responsive CopG/Arc/MetJ family transcriptional regulator